MLCWRQGHKRVGATYRSAGAGLRVVGGQNIGHNNNSRTVKVNDGHSYKFGGWLNKETNHASLAVSGTNETTSPRKTESGF